jgi:hypothetical protein
VACRGGASEYALVKAIGRLTPTWGGCADIDAGRRWLGDRLCTGPFDIAGICVKANYVFRSDRFVKVELHFSAHDFDRIAPIFVERYGTPTYRSQDLNRWEGTSVLIMLSRYVDGKGYASIATQDELRESKRLRDEQTKGAAKGL